MDQCNGEMELMRLISTQNVDKIIIMMRVPDYVQYYVHNQLNSVAME